MSKNLFVSGLRLSAGKGDAEMFGYSWKSKDQHGHIGLILGRMLNRSLEILRSERARQRRSAGYLAGRPTITSDPASREDKRALGRSSNDISLDTAGLQARNRATKSHQRIEHPILRPLEAPSYPFSVRLRRYGEGEQLQAIRIRSSRR